MQYGLNAVWQQGDAVARAIMLLLILMSMLSWGVIFYKGMELVRLKRRATAAERDFWLAGSLVEAQASLGRAGPGNPHLDLVEAAQEAYRGPHSEEMMAPDEWLHRCLGIALDEHLARLASGLGVLASIGSTAPFIGLFGTVWGIYHALMAISAAGQSSLSQVAGPVGESLVMTAFGLFVAIPAVLGYNTIARNNRGVAHKLHRFRHELHSFFVRGERGRASKGTNIAPSSRPALSIMIQQGI
ncbi:MotA/TolQ/ExbB proton channel family protein [Cupriavidus basilensis]|uniref:MotA/TolQ/ExbB proton channel family protein n=1 Tax=Cupriavidus basilensis TaxID=68895 RepID=UPI000750962D|nr:MotA/TolQ/ExbB proton channel family protein [Cupriavidus basilensis]